MWTSAPPSPPPGTSFLSFFFLLFTLGILTWFLEEAQVSSGEPGPPPLRGSVCGPAAHVCLTWMSLSCEDRKWTPCRPLQQQVSLLTCAGEEGAGPQCSQALMLTDLS